MRNASIHLVHSLAMSAYLNATVGRTPWTRAGIVVMEGDQTVAGSLRQKASVSDMASSMGMALQTIVMTGLADDGDTIRSLRPEIEAILQGERPVIFVLDQAQDAQGDMLARVTRSVVSANRTNQAIVLAIGYGAIRAEGLARDMADGMGSSTTQIVGSPAFLEIIDKAFDRL